MRLEVVKVDHVRFAAEILRGNARVNLTQMAKPFGKRPIDWLKTNEAKEYLEAVAKVQIFTLADYQSVAVNNTRVQKRVLADLVEVRAGGIPGTNGTWCNDRRIALRFAQWLSPEFAVAVDDVLLRLMFGDAVFAEPINGVEPMISGGKAWYNYRDALESFGCRRGNSASRRKLAMPHCFRVFYGCNFITKEYFLALKSYYDWRNQYRQLVLPFSTDIEDVPWEA